MKLRPTIKREVEREVGSKGRVTISTAVGAGTSRDVVRLQPECPEGNGKIIALSVALSNDDSAIMW